MWVETGRRDAEMQGTPQRGTITRWPPVNQRGDTRIWAAGFWLRWLVSGMTKEAGHTEL